VTGCTFLITIFLLIPLIFGRHMLQNDTTLFPHSEVIMLCFILNKYCNNRYFNNKSLMLGNNLKIYFNILGFILTIIISKVR